MPEKNTPKQNDVDISKRSFFRSTGNKSPILWIFVLFLLVVVLTSALSQKSAPQKEAPPWLGPHGPVFVMVPVFIGFVGFVIVGKLFADGFFTWVRLARKPAQLMSRGEADGAKKAYQHAVARARQFAAKDHRRGWMLRELGLFLANQGRCRESAALYEEAIEIFAQLGHKQLLNYFLTLNNYAVLLIGSRDFAAAQRMLETAIGQARGSAGGLA